MMLFTEELQRARRATIWGSVVGLAALAALWLVLAAASGCATPGPVNPPAGPPDLFTNFVADCHLEVVAVERESAKPDVRRCYAELEPAPCFVRMVERGGYQAASVACVARDVGAAENAEALADPTDLESKAIADAARRWVTDHRVGYR